MSSQMTVVITVTKVKKVSDRKALATSISLGIHRSVAGKNWETDLDKRVASPLEVNLYNLDRAQQLYDDWRSNRSKTPVQGVPYMPSKGRVFRAVVKRMNSDAFSVMVQACLAKRISPLDYVYNLFMQNYTTLIKLFPPENEGIEFKTKGAT